MIRIESFIRQRSADTFSFALEVLCLPRGPRMLVARSLIPTTRSIDSRRMGLPQVRSRCPPKQTAIVRCWSSPLSITLLVHNTSYCQCRRYNPGAKRVLTYRKDRVNSDIRYINKQTRDIWRVTFVAQGSWRLSPSRALPPLPCETMLLLKLRVHTSTTHHESYQIAVIALLLVSSSKL